MSERRRRKRRKTKDSLSSGGSPPTQNSGEVHMMHETEAPAASIEESEQPSLKEMWKVLSRIEENTATLLAENASLKTNLESTQAEFKILSEQNKKLHDRILELERRDFVKSKKIEELEAKYDDAEQYSRKFNLEIDGVPESEGEDVSNIVLDLAETVEVDLQEEDIDMCHRFYKGEGKARPIIVKFSNYTSKSEMYSARFSLRNLDLAAKFGSEKIFINENLTTRRATLYAKVRRKVKTLAQWKMWTTDGKIFVKKALTGHRIRINTEEDLKKIVPDQQDNSNVE